MKRKKRIPIPTSLRRELLIEASHKCSISACQVMQNLEVHHINRKPYDNRLENLIMLCPTHHAMADAKLIDRKSCLQYKKLLNQTNEYPATKIYDTLLSIESKLSDLTEKKSRRNKK